jgi:hypothetical protein
MTMTPTPDDDGEDIFEVVGRLENKLDHIHDDLAAIREWCRIPRPACYGAAPVEDERAPRAEEE